MVSNLSQILKLSDTWVLEFQIQDLASSSLLYIVVFQLAKMWLVLDEPTILEAIDQETLWNNSLLILRHPCKVTWFSKNIQNRYGHSIWFLVSQAHPSGRTPLSISIDRDCGSFLLLRIVIRHAAPISNREILGFRLLTFVQDPKPEVPPESTQSIVKKWISMWTTYGNFRRFLTAICQPLISYSKSHMDSHCAPT